MSLSSDFGAFTKVIVNDDSLKTLMNIPVIEKTDYGLLIDKYFLQTFISDKFTDDNICRILIRNGMQQDTDNDFVKWTGVIFEIYVPKSIDLMSGFETRINQISDRLQELFNRELINDNKLYLKSIYEQASLTRFFKRYNVKFQYKKIYK